MSLLPANYFDTPAPTAAPVSAAPPDPSKLMNPSSTLGPAAPEPAPQQPITAPVQPSPAMPGQAPLNSFGNQPAASSSASTPALAPRSYAPGLGYLIPNALGFGLPDPDTFQNMSAKDKAIAYGEGALNATKKLATGLVSAIPLGIASLGATADEAAQGFVASAKTGFKVDPITALKNSAQPNLGGVKSQNHVEFNVPGFGAAPSWFKTYDDAIGQGASPLAASLLTAGTAIGDATIFSGIAESLGNLAKPKPTTTGAQATNLEPIKTAIVSDNGKVKFSPKADSVNEYYDAAPSIAKKYGGNSGNIKVKLSPVGDGTMDASIVKLGGKKGTPSDFHGVNETELFSQNVKMAPEAQAQTSPEGVPLPASEQGSNPPINIPNKVVNGTENNPITQDQLNTLDTISKVNGVSDNAKIGIINAVTGKTSMGDLTNADFIKVASQLGKMSDAATYSPTMTLNNFAAEWVGQRGPYFKNIQDASGQTLRTGDMYNMAENGKRMFKIQTETDKGYIRDIYGDHWNPEVREAVTAWKGGDTAAITENKNWTPEQKAQILEIAEKSKAYQAKLATDAGLPEDKFLPNYSTRVQDTGGPVTHYTDPNEFPGSSDTPFFKNKRTGGIGPVMTDDAAIMHVYSRAAARAQYLGKDLFDFMKSVHDGADPQYKPAIKAYAEQVAGNSGQVERWLNNVAAKMNGATGMNLPADTARKMIQLSMDTSYGATLGFNPGTVMRQLITNPTFVYAEEGPEFIGRALADYFKDPGAAVKELQSRGLRIQTADPYGSAIAGESTKFGKLSNQYRRLVSASMAPLNVADSFGRYLAMRVSDLKFNDALDLYNSGKISWQQAEQKMDFDGMSVTDQNAIRQSIAKGDRDTAMNQRAMTKVDATQGPYRPGTMGRASDNPAGRALLQFDTHAINYGQMLSTWVSKGQWDKMLRFVGVQSVVTNTMLKNFGLDYSKDQGLQPLNPTLSPMAKNIASIFGVVQAAFQNSQKDINSNAAAIFKEVKTLSVPGVQPARMAGFVNSYNDTTHQTKDANGNTLYPIYTSSGSLLQHVPFKDLLLNLFGLPVSSVVGANNFMDSEENAKTNFESANAPQNTKSEYVPLPLRIFQGLPGQVKGQFGDQLDQYSK